MRSPGARKSPHIGGPFGPGPRLSFLATTANRCIWCGEEGVIELSSSTRGPAAAAAQIDRFIESQARKNGDANYAARMWAESERRYLELKRRKHNAERYRFEMDMCETHERLAAEHEERARRLLEENG